MARIVVIYAHPYPNRSRAGRALLECVTDLPDLTVSSLYDRYPDFAVDVAREQKLLQRARVIVWQCPIYWYSVPALLKLWFEKVLTDDFAYGTEGNALTGKPVLWVTTTGTPLSSYRTNGVHHHAFDAFIRPVEETARFCGMNWQPPIVVHDAHDVSDDELRAHGATYRSQLEHLLSTEAADDG